jgi:hypothetical protein
MSDVGYDAHGRQTRAARLTMGIAAHMNDGADVGHKHRP